VFGNNVQIVMISSMGSSDMEQAKRFSATLMQGILRNSYQQNAPQRALSPAEQLARQQHAQRQQAQQGRSPS
jgi:hypothetical protein